MGTNYINGGNPYFANPAGYDFHITSSASVLIDKGLTIASFSTDKDGVTRPQGSAWDIGAFEYKGGGAGTVNTGALEAPTIASFSTDSNIVGDGITNDNTLRLTGTAAANSTVKVYDGATQIGSTTANSSGSWSYTTGPLANGKHSLTATATNGGTTSASSSPLSVTVDTVAPAAPVITNDTVNGNNSVTLTGAAEANSTVKVLDAGTQIGTATANGSGAWSYTTSILTSGAHSLTARAMDAAGNNSPESAERVVTTGALEAPTIVSFSTDSNIVGDGITNDNTLRLTGTAAANSTIKVYDGATQIGSTTANSSGSWSYTTGPLANGKHSLTATATNGGTTSASSSPLSVTVDTVAPAAPVITNDTVNGNNSVTLTGAAEANSTVKVLDAGTQIGTATANGSGAWSYTTSILTSGAHSLTVTATDAAGNTSVASQPLDQVIDGASGTTTNLVANGDFETGDFTGWVLSGNVAPSTYGPQTYINSTAESGQYAAGLGPLGSDGTLSQVIQTTAGQHYTLSFWLANAGGAPNDFTVKWNGQTLVALVNESTQGYKEYTFDVLGIAGTSNLEFDFQHDPSHWNLDSISVMSVGSQAPAAPVIASFSTDSNIVGDGITNDNTLRLTGTAAANSTVKVYDGATQIGSTTANSSGSWSYTTGPLANGKHSLTATATNGGTTSASSSPLLVTVDTVAPAAPVITNDTVNGNNSVTLTGAAEANSTVKVLDAGTQIGTATANGSGAWSYTTSILTSGAHSLTVTATDAAGNTSVASQPLDQVIDGASGTTTNLVANGDFETGDFTGWVLSGNVAPSTYGPQTYINSTAESGQYAAGLGPLGSDGTLSQVIQTTAGQHYTLSFWLANAGGAPNDFIVKWNGQTLVALVNESTQGYKEYTFDVLGIAGTSNLEFDFQHDPSHWNLDSISVMAVGSQAPAAAGNTSATSTALNVTLDTAQPTFTNSADTVTLPAIGGTFNALGGDDQLSYTGGFVAVDGGTGADTVDFSAFGSAVWVNLAYAGHEAWSSRWRQPRIWCLA